MIKKRIRAGCLLLLLGVLASAGKEKAQKRGAACRPSLSARELIFRTLLLWMKKAS
nr:hypothetical protein [Bacillus velezensis]